MPKRTGMLDSGNFVRSPELPLDEGFVAYLDQVDRLLERWHKGLQFYQVVSPRKGGNSDAGNIQLLCQRCAPAAVV